MDGRLKKQRRGWLTSYLWSAPSLALIALIVVFPILYTFFISLTNMNVYHWFDFTIIGLDNYVKALFVFDSGFLSALINTVLWTVVNMVVQLILAFVLASLLNIKRLRLRKLYKTLLMFPWAMPGYVSILLWKTGMFNTEFGLLNQWMEKLGLEAQRWLASDVSAFICCTIVNLWLALPFMLMIMDGAMPFRRAGSREGRGRDERQKTARGRRPDRPQYLLRRALLRDAHTHPLRPERLPERAERAFELGFLLPPEGLHAG